MKEMDNLIHFSGFSHMHPDYMSILPGGYDVSKYWQIEDND